MKFNLFNSFMWKSKVKYDNKENLIKTLSEDFYKNRNKFTPAWGCFVYSSFKDREQNKIPEDLLDIFEEKIREYINNCPEELKIKGNMYLKDIWYNVYEKNYSQDVHDHGDSFISGCYYLKFNKNTHHQTTFYNPSYIFDFEKLEKYSYFSFEPDCEEDDLIIFPSGIKHGTKGLKDIDSNELRITISFNIINPDILPNEEIQNKGVIYN